MGRENRYLAMGIDDHIQTMIIKYAHSYLKHLLIKTKPTLWQGCQTHLQKGG